MQPTPDFSDPYASSQKKTWLWLGGGFVLLAALVGFGWGAGYLFQGAGGPKPALGQQAASGPSSLGQQASPPPPALPQNAEAPVTMPDDIYRWLLHLEETERRQRELVADQAAAVMVAQQQISGVGSIGTYEGLLEGDIDRATNDFDQHEARDLTTSMEKEWQALQQFFDSYPPPSECRPIATNYDSAMGETSGMMLELADVLGSLGDISQIQNALATAMKMKDQSKTRIDPARKESDRLVGDICLKYNTRKWFDIPGDIAPGGFLGIGGGGGMGGLGGLGGLGGGLEGLEGLTP